jgi:hypothetical protein
MDTATASDRRLGATITLGTIAVAGALAMLIGAESAVARGTGFATAVLAGGLLIVALHTAQ